VLSHDPVDQLFREIFATEGYRLALDLDAQTVTLPRGDVWAFKIDPAYKHNLLQGLDDIGITLQHAGEIRAYETARRKSAPWLFTTGSQRQA